MAKYPNLTLLQVEKLAGKIAKTSSASGLTVGLIGNLGGGKTTFAKAFAKALGIRALKSPTFIVSHRYTLKDQFLYHLDFYRLHKQKELEVLGLSEILSGGNIVLIEWVDKFPRIKKRCDLLIQFTVKPNNKRDVTIQTN